MVSLMAVEIIMLGFGDLWDLSVVDRFWKMKKSEEEEKQRRSLEKDRQTFDSFKKKLPNKHMTKLPKQKTISNNFEICVSLW